MPSVVRLLRLATRLGDERRKATDTALPSLDLAEGAVGTNAEFDQLVSRLYVWFHEGCRPDIAFLLGSVSASGLELSRIRRFRSDLNTLRQSAQHSQDATVDRDAAQWFKEASGAARPSTPDGWEQSASHLVGLGEAALEVAIAAARNVAGDDLVSSQWRRAVQARDLDLRSALSSVLSAIGRRASRNQFAHLERQLEHDWSRQARYIGPEDDEDDMLLAAAERAAVGWVIAPLPCSPTELLSTLSIPAGDTQAVVALLIAHAVAETSMATGGAFITDVHRMWAQLRDKF